MLDALQDVLEHLSWMPVSLATGKLLTFLINLPWCAMQYGHQPSYAPQQAAPPQMPPHQMPYASQPMYAQTAAAYPAYPQAAPAQSYYTAPAHAYPQPQMHEPPIQQPQSAAQAAMMAAIKVSTEQHALALMSCLACLLVRVSSVF